VKAIKLLLKLLVAVLVVAMAVGVGISMFVDPNDYRDELARMVKENTGRELQIKEGMKISLFPWIGVRAAAVELGNAPGFGGDPMVRVASLELRVRLEPLLRRQVEVDTIVIKGLDLNLERNAQGVGNWEHMGRQTDGTPPGTDSKDAGAGEGTAQGASDLMAAVVFQGIEVENGRIQWKDARSGDSLQLEHLGLVVGRLVSGEPVAVDLRTDVRRPQASQSGRMALKGKVQVDLKQGLISGMLDALSVTLADPAGTAEGVNLALAGRFSARLADMAVGLDLDKGELKAAESALNGTSMQADFKGRMEWDPGKQLVRLDLKQVGLAAGGTRLAGVKAHAGMDVDGQLDLTTMTVVAVLTGLNVEAREGALKEGFVRMESLGRVRADLNRRRVDVSLEGATVKGEGAVFSGGGFSSRMEVEVKADLEQQMVTTLLDKATLELTGGVFNTGGGEFKFSSDTRIALATGRLEGHLTGMTFALHGPMVDNGRVDGAGTVDWNMLLAGADPVVVNLNGVSVQVRDGFMGRNGHAQMNCQMRMTVHQGGDRLQGAIKECSLTAKGPVVGGGLLEGRFAGEVERSTKEGWLRLKPFELALKNTGGTLVAGDSNIEGHFDLTVDLESRHYAANFAKLILETRGELLSGGRGRMDLKGQVEADLKKGEVRTHANRLELVVQGGAVGKGRLQLAGPAEIHTLLAGPRVQTTLKEMALSYQGENPSGGNLEGTLSGAVDADMTKGTLDLSGVEFVAAGARLNGDMNVVGLGAKPTWDGTWRLHEFNLADTMKKLRMDPIRTRDGRSLRKLSLMMTVKGGHDHLSLKGIDLVLDDSHMKGQLDVVKFDPPNLAFEFDIDTLDLDRYRGPEDKSEPASMKGGKGGRDSKGQESGSSSGGLLGLPDLKGKIRLGRFKIFDVRMTDALVNLTANKGVLDIHQESRLYEGTLKGDAAVDFRSGKPKTVLKTALTAVQGGPLLADVTGVDRIIGKANANVDLSMQGADADEIKRTLTGTTRFAFGDGAIKGINLAKMIRTTYQMVKGSPPVESGGGEQTDFSEFSASVNWDKGLARNDDLNLKSPLLRVGGDGQLDLPRDSVNYQLRVAVVGSLVGQGGKTVTELKNITVPIRVTGSPTRPHYQVDLKGLLKDNVKEETKQKIMDKLEKKMDDGLRDKLKEKGLDRVLEQAVPKGLDVIINKLPF